MSWIDLLIFCTYLISMLAVGDYFMRKNKTTDDYFVGGRNLNSLHIGLSVVATDVGGGFSIGLGIKGLNAEMTDFATHKKYLGNNLSVLLLKRMEEEMKKQGIKTVYTIARLNSIPMNKTFLKLDYSYSGTLINNTNIAGSIESMNVYYKQI